MRLHREGYKIMLVTALLLLALNWMVCYSLQIPIVCYILIILSIVFYGLVVQFFRVPKRPIHLNEQHIISPADGKVVVIEEVEETEYFNEKRIQVSVFMSPLNVHVNWHPMSGIVKYAKYHAGKFLVAWHPKSSTENERTTVVVENKNGIQVLFRQIAGAVARRIVMYSKEGDVVEQCSEAGFIKFGSRVDVFLPLDAKIEVEIDQVVQGTQTLLATLNKS